MAPGLYIDGGLSVADNGIEIYRQHTTTTVIKRDGLIETGEVVDGSFTRTALNPYGRLALGYEHQIHPQLRFNVELYHESSVETTADRGVNGARMSLRWFPFGGR